jgi:hypothetical protein
MKDLQNEEIWSGRCAVDVYNLRSIKPSPRVVVMEYRPHESPANARITNGAVDAVGILQDPMLAASTSGLLFGSLR